MIPKLLFNITQCKNFNSLINKSSPLLPCNEIVNFQHGVGVKKINDFQIPEPWNGDIVNAPILIISSNPAYSNDELYPDLSWPNEMIADFFINRFAKRGQASWVEGHRVLNKNGSRGRVVNYWTNIQRRVDELLGEIGSEPGKDYCITELVHCKSSSEIGVRSALPTCANLYLSGKYNISGACIIIAVGSFVRDYYQNSPLINGLPVIYIPHPNARVPRNISDHYSEEQIVSFRNHIKNCKPKNRDIQFSQINLPKLEDVNKFIQQKIKDNPKQN
jgi:hypothetical protein